MSKTKTSNTIVSYERDFPELEDRDAAERPTKYLRKAEGTDDFEVVDGRRPSRMLLVNKLRDAVDAWRAADYAGASATTCELFHHWFSGTAATTGEPFTLYWGQREAVETLAYLIEVEGVRDAQQLIANVMSKCIVYRFEIVYIEMCDAEGTSIPARTV